jgi:RES domain-containing protein
MASLEEILASLERRAWSGRVFRVTLGDYPPDRENTLGARWNPPDIAAIYLSLAAETAVSEVEYNLKRQPRRVKPALRKTLYEIEVSLDAAVKLEDVLPELRRNGIGDAQLFAEDLKASQEIGRLVTWFGADGLLVPSARAAGTNLVIYPRWAGDGYRFEVVKKSPLPPLPP